MAYNPNTHEQVLDLKDGRRLHKTHNGFQSFVTDKKGNITSISSKYYNKVKHNKV